MVFILRFIITIAKYSYYFVDPDEIVASTHLRQYIKLKHSFDGKIAFKPVMKPPLANVL